MQANRSKPLLKAGLLVTAFATAFSMTWVARQGFEGMIKPPARAPLSVLDASAQHGPAVQAQQLPRGRHQANGSGQTGKTGANLVNGLWVINAAAHLESGPAIALPSGSRLRVDVKAAQASEVTIKAINPAGVQNTAPLWQTQLRAGEHRSGPAMRLTGQRGEERLIVTYRDHSGRLLRQHVLHIMHL